MRKLGLAALVTAGLLVAGGTNAATLVVEQTLTSGAFFGDGGGYSPAFGPLVDPAFGPYVSNYKFPAQFLNEGDTLDWRLKMAPGDLVTITGLQALGISLPQIMIGYVDDMISTGSVSFLDANRNTLLTGGTHTLTNSTPTADYFTTTPGGDTISFAEIDALITIDGFGKYSLGIPLTGAYFTQPYVYNVDAAGITYPPSQYPTGGPEPSTWALMLIGFGTAGAALRRRRRLQAI